MIRSGCTGRTGDARDGQVEGARFVAAMEPTCFAPRSAGNAVRISTPIAVLQ